VLHGSNLKRGCERQEKAPMNLGGLYCGDWAPATGNGRTRLAWQSIKEKRN
jgi:hypothetical protein